MPARGAKRRKSTPRPAPSDKHAAFAAWARSQGVLVDGVEPASLPGRGVGLVTTRSIKKDERLIHVPESCMLAPASDLFLDECARQLSPQAKLAATLIGLRAAGDARYETCAGVWPTDQDFESSLAWYKRSSAPEHMPLFPKSLQTHLNRLVQDCQRDRNAISVMIDDGQLKGRQDDFWYSWAIANTRSFSWKPSGRKHGIMVMCPFLDYMNHCPAGQGCQVEMNDEGYVLVANRDYEVGEEILATYGAHGNDKLLCHYGFVLDSSPDDSVSLDEMLLPALSCSQKNDLESVGYLGNYLLAPSTNEICFRTQVALRVLCSLTSNEWEFFMGSGDDIAEDKSGEVERRLRGLMEAFMPVLRRRSESLEEMKAKATTAADKSVLGLVIDRWKQIGDALSVYTNQPRN